MAFTGTLHGMLIALEELAKRIASVCRKSVLANGKDLSQVVGQGVGDTTFGIDVAPEAVVSEWAEELAASGPLSILTEDSGWRHLGPSGPLLDFDHGGPRIVVDPVDGSRNLMVDLRSAWAAIAAAPPGPEMPHLSELTHAVVQELATQRAGKALRLTGTQVGPKGTCVQTLFELTDHGLGQQLEHQQLLVDSDDRVDLGFMPFFRYHPAERESLAHLEVEFFNRLHKHEGASLDQIFDDQYISNSGQLVLLAQGKYRMVADLRAAIAARGNRETVASKPYDVAAAIVCARAAGAIVEDAKGRTFDTPLDATTPLSFVGYSNKETRSRLRPHLLATLDGDD